MGSNLKDFSADCAAAVTKVFIRSSLVRNGPAAAGAGHASRGGGCLHRETGRLQKKQPRRPPAGFQRAASPLALFSCIFSGENAPSAAGAAIIGHSPKISLSGNGENSALPRSGTPAPGGALPAAQAPHGRGLPASPLSGESPSAAGAAILGHSPKISLSGTGEHVSSVRLCRPLRGWRRGGSCR